MFKYDQEVLR
jgi:hypothetical protein